MSIYKHTVGNRIISPDKYMYTSFEGNNFLKTYYKDRLRHIESAQEFFSYPCLYKIPENLYLKVHNALKLILENNNSSFYPNMERLHLNIPSNHNSYYENKQFNIYELSSYNLNTEINSENLITSILNEIVHENSSESIKYWMDLLIQRFEVTKKIYQTYPKNFSRGEGSYDSINTYWIFALSLALYFSKSHNIKYLNTLLKVVDLLCSLSNQDIKKDIPSSGFTLILLVELIFIKGLSSNIERVNFEYN